jgi:YD repeat-containing protein
VANDTESWGTEMLAIRVGSGGTCGIADILASLNGRVPYQPGVAELVKQRTAAQDEDPNVHCMPRGAPRIWTYTYNGNGQVLTMDGPRTDVADTTTYTYYANDDADLGKRGNVATITNAAGHTTSITAYNAHGQPLTIVDANGLTTTLTYDARQRLTSRTVGGETTAYTYDNAGQLTKVTLPDLSFLSYSYDAAHRLIGMQDNLGNRIAYTLDLAGNRTKDEVFDPANALAQTRSRVYSSLNRLFQELGATNQTTEYAYDNQDNVINVTLREGVAVDFEALRRNPGAGAPRAARELEAVFLTQLLQAMRRTIQTSEYIERLGPFFVGHAYWQSSEREGREAG